MSSDIPDWLNAAFLAQVYKQELKDADAPAATYEIVQCGSVVGVGDNYLSQMYRVTVKVTSADGKEREESLVIKSLEKTDAMMKEYGIFKIEFEMYDKVLPKFEGYWSEVGQPEVQFGPKCFLATDQPHDLLVFSDLKQGGYIMEDRFERLSLEHARLTLSKLAKFHASGLLYKEREGEVPKAVQRKYIEKVFAEVFGKMLPGNLASLTNKLREVGLDEYVEKIQKWETCLLPAIIRATDPDPADFNVLVHADLWLNNQLFQYDDQKALSDVKFVDYQLSFWGNPAFDILYFIFTSVKPEIVVEQFDNLVVFYHEELVKAMGALKVQLAPPALQQIQQQITKSGFFVATLLIDIIPVVIMDRSELANMDSFMAEPDSETMGKLRYQMMNNPRYEQVLKLYLPYWDQRGYLESTLTEADLPEEYRQLLRPAKVVEVVEKSAVIPANGDDVAEKRAPTAELNLPNWLTNEFIRAALPAGADQVEITKCSSVVEIGDNYVSQMFRVAVEFKEPHSGDVKEESLVIKSLEKTDALLKSFGVFDTEKEAYVEALPAFEQVWTDKGAPMDFGPKCLLATAEPHDLFILQDLNKAGFKMADRFTKLDLAHAQLTLAKLAKFHAASVVQKERIGSYGKQLSRKFVEEELMVQMMPIMLPKIIDFTELVKTLDLGDEITSKCAAWATADPKEIVQLTDPDYFPDYFQAVVHSDLWMNNIMYKYNANNDPEDVIFLDFQGTYWGNPVMDILYFLFSSLQHQALINNFDNLIKHYHGELVRAFDLLGSPAKAPNFEAFAIQVHQSGYYAAMLMHEIVPIVVMERHSDANIESFMDPNSEGSKNMSRKMFHNPKFIEIARDLLPFLNDMGWLEATMPKQKAQPEAKPRTVVPVAAAAVEEQAVQSFAAVEPEITKPIVADPVIEAQKTVPVTNGYHVDSQPIHVPITPAAPNKPRLQSRIEETINKFAALGANGNVPQERGVRASAAADTPKGYPKWLDRFYFNDILRKDYSSFKIFKFFVGPASGKGENYASLMYRVQISVEIPQKGLVKRNFMVKVNHTEGPAAQMLALINFFPKEIEMYTTFLPKFEEMYAAAGDKLRIGPTCVVGTQDPADLLIMEDLSLEGFKSAERMKGLDPDHIRFTVAKLAKFHAASAVWVDKGGKYPEKYDEGMFAERLAGMMEGMFQKNIDIMRSVSSKWKCAAGMAKYLDNWQPLMMDRLIPMLRRDESRFNVLNHGDMWVNNIMYRYSGEGKVEECILVDYQICNYNSPMLDLNYFIFTSVQKDMKLSKIDFIIQYYHTELVANLKLLGYSKPVPTLHQLQRDFLHVGLFGFMAAIMVLPIALLPPSENSDMDSFLADTDQAMQFKADLYGNPQYVAAMEELVPYFERKGYLDM